MPQNGGSARIMCAGDGLARPLMPRNANRSLSVPIPLFLIHFYFVILPSHVQTRCFGFLYGSSLACLLNFLMFRFLYITWVLPCPDGHVCSQLFSVKTLAFSCCILYITLHYRLLVYRKIR
ncbi:hypothetical protein DUNSADRAFT_13349 [Dunaliella salina]|uniref:Encoded protein n=1 Tax=Dunaliella salina TaxID=3046 RepID=A0ABQ7G9M8_DUNSA|nr:hypothetical protein DUNSADRAFT_13349 [Dunaliella salina]|eukprot:KAF5831265.1 hypothetical protein DUNSADRAFT_13349 [Dunaliella salina]